MTRGMRPARRAMTVLAVAATVLAAAGAAQASDLHLMLVDNSQADSWLEVDRTGNLEIGDGTAGSDHDGSAVDLMDTLVNRDSTDDESEEEPQDQNQSGNEPGGGSGSGSGDASPGGSEGTG